MKFTNDPPALKCKQCAHHDYPTIRPAQNDSSHHAKLECAACGAFLDWMDKPENQKTRSTKGKYTPEYLGIGYCEICLRHKKMLGKTETLEVHHKIPVWLGGDDEPFNLMVVCTYCHKDIHLKHNYLYLHFKPKDIEDSFKKQPDKSALATTKVDPKHVFISLTLKGGKDHYITTFDVEKLQKSYPGLDVKSELRKMHEWCNANPVKRKTPTGIKAFITRWLNRAQNNPRQQVFVSDKPQDYDPRPKTFPMQSK